MVTFRVVLILLVSVIFSVDISLAKTLESIFNHSGFNTAHYQYTPTYYVGTENCDDDGAGTQDTPFCSVQTGLDKLEAGDVLMILNGVYHERVYLANSGTEDSPIVVTGESLDAIIDAGCPDYPCDESIIDAGEEFLNLEDDNEPLYSGFFIGWGEYITLDGFTVRNAPTHGVEVVDATGVTIHNMRVQNAVMSVINVYDSFDLSILNNEISGGNLGWITAEGRTIHITFEEAVSIVNTDRFEIANNHLHDGFKEGIVVKVGSRNGQVHNNLIERLCSVGIYIDEAHHTDVFGNTISDIGFIRNTVSDIGRRGDDVQRCDEVLSGLLNFDSGNETGTLDYEPGDGIMLAVGDLGYGLDTGELSNIRIFQNIVKDVNVGCMVLWDELRETGRAEPGTLENVEIFNNVFYNCARSRAGWGPGIILDSSAVGAQIYNNIIAGASDSILDDGSDTRISNNLFFLAGNPVGEQSIAEDPLFIDPDAGDFGLQSGSPAIDAGRNVGLPYAGNAPDIGAIESD